MNYNRIAIFIFPMICVAAANDKEYWIKKAEDNANKNLDQWPQTVDALFTKNDATTMKIQVDLLKSQVVDSLNNLNTFVPQLISIVDRINSTVAEEPNLYRRIVLKSILWFMTGKRDNKSYYLMDGADKWISKRLSNLHSKGDRARQLAAKLMEVQKSVINLRDELDSDAQNYVNDLAGINKLSGDICGNVQEIRGWANKMSAALHNSHLLNNAKITNDLVDSIIV